MGTRSTLPPSFVTERRGEFVLKISGSRGRLRLHRIALAGARDHEAQPLQFGMALADLGLPEYCFVAARAYRV
jgi:hypothetical protein